MSGPHVHPQGHTTPGIVAGVAAVLMWAAGNIMVRGVPMSGVQIAFWRILLGAMVYWLLVKSRRRSLRWEHLKASAPAGIAISIEIAVFFVALKTTTVANAVIIGSLQPLVLLTFATRRFGERRSGLLIAVASVAVGGVALVLFGSTSQPTWSPRGDILAFMAMLLFSAYYVLAKDARQRVPALEFQAGVWIVGTFVLAPIAVIEAGGVVVPSAQNWLWLLALLAVPGTGHLLMNWSHNHIRLSLAAMLSLGITVLSTIGAAIFLDEHVAPIQVVGIVIVLTVMAYAITQEAALGETHTAPQAPVSVETG